MRSGRREEGKMDGMRSGWGEGAMDGPNRG